MSHGGCARRGRATRRTAGGIACAVAAFAALGAIGANQAASGGDARASRAAGPCAPIGARVAGPLFAQVEPLRDGRIGSTSRIGGPIDARIALPTAFVATGSAPSREKAIPYRVEPRDDFGDRVSPWDLPPEVPDSRDFERAETFDELSSPHYEIREEIWSTPEDLVTRTGYARYGGLAYVPFWAHNTIRLGRWSLVPFAHVEGIWHSDFGGGQNDSKQATEVMTSVGTLGEYWGAGAKYKVKFSARADYHWYDEVYDPAYTYVGGASLEMRLSPDHTLEIGGEAERARRTFDLDTTLGKTENLFDRQTVFVNGRWDRFLSGCLRLEGGASYTWLDEIDSDINGGDYTEVEAFARLGMDIMRHESFAYAEYRYQDRDADGISSDLNFAHEVRLGVDGILPQARTRRLVGNAYFGYRWEDYLPSTQPGSVGAGGDTQVELLTLGGDLTYKPTPYTSGNLSYQRTNTFSAVSNFNTVDTVTLAISQNLTQTVIGRVAGTWTNIQPDGSSDSQRAGIGVGVRWLASDNVDIFADYEFEYRFEGAGYDQADGHRVAAGATFHLR